MKVNVSFESPCLPKPCKLLSMILNDMKAPDSEFHSLHNVNRAITAYKNCLRVGFLDLIVSCQRKPTHI